MKIAHVLKTLTGGWLAALCFACSPQMPDAYTESQDAPDIYPDYTDVTVPPNIAPLRWTRRLTLMQPASNIPEENGPRTNGK